MHVLIFGRTIPTAKTGSLGLFEFEQAKALAAYAQVGYMFLDTDSLLTNRKVKKVEEYCHGLFTIGYFFPLGRSLRSIYRRGRFQFFNMAYQIYVKTQGKPDVIHVHYPSIVLTHEIIDFITNNNIKLVLTEHWSKALNKKISEEQIAILKHARSAAKMTICVSEELKNSVQELTEDSSDKDITIIPNMITDDFFKPYDRKGSGINCVTFTYVGNLKRIKCVDLLISSFQEVFQNNKRVKLNIVGDGPEKNTLKKQINKEFENRIKFWGNVPPNKVYEILTLTDVYVSASQHESFGVPFIEALAMGIPVIASSNMPITIYLDEHKGLIFEAGNKEDLSSKMAYIYKNVDDYDPELVRSEIYENFNREHIAKEIISIYEK